MIQSLFFRWAYWRGKPRWDTGVTPPEVAQAFASGTILPGPALDLGCGTGTNVVYMARQGRQVSGIDFVPAAIQRAEIRARQAGVAEQVHWYVADVTRLEALPLPRLAFALDMGCFHGLSPAGQQRYVQGLAALMLPGARYMLYALGPRRPGKRPLGVTPEQVQAAFTPWFEVERVEPGEMAGHPSAWYWMIRKRV